MVDSRRAVRSAFWSSLESGGLAILSFGTLVVYTRLLSPAEMGLFAIALALTEILGLFVTMSFHDALVQKPDADEADFDTAFTITVAVSLVLCALYVFAAAPVARLMGDEAAAPVFAWLGLFFPLSGLSSTIMARQRRDFEFRSLATRSLIGRLAGAICGIAAAAAGWGVMSLVVQQLVMGGAATAVLWLLASKHPRIRFHVAAFAALARFSAGAFGALLLNFALKRVFIIMVGAFLGIASAGLVNVAFRAMDALWSLSAAAVQQVALPMLSRLQDDEARLKRAYQGAMGLSCALLYPCFIGLALTAPEIVHLLFGPKWSAAAPYLASISTLVLLQIPRMFVGTMLTARGRPFALLPGIGAQILFLVVAIGLFGIPTPAWAVGLWIGCELVLAPVASYMLWRGTRLTLADQFRGVTTPLLATIVMAGGILALRYIAPAWLTGAPLLLLLVPGGIAIYAIALLGIDRSLVSDVLGRLRGALHRGDPATA